MRFSKTPKESCLISENYNPGPGFYLGNDKRYSDVLKYSHPYYGGQDQTNTFSREMRFRKQKLPEIKPGPGTYNFKKSFLSQEDFNKVQTSNLRFSRHISTSNSTQQLQSFKVNSVPSIPSAHFSPGYQEIRDGLVIQMKDQSKTEQQRRVGPGTYNPKVEMIKPRKSTTIIRSQSSKQVSKKKVQQAPTAIDLCLFAHNKFFEN